MPQYHFAKTTSISKKLKRSLKSSETGKNRDRKCERERHTHKTLIYEVWGKIVEQLDDDNVHLPCTNPAVGYYGVSSKYSSVFPPLAPAKLLAKVYLSWAVIMQGCTLIMSYTKNSNNFRPKCVSMYENELFHAHFGLRTRITFCIFSLLCSSTNFNFNLIEKFIYRVSSVFCSFWLIYTVSACRRCMQREYSLSLVSFFYSFLSSLKVLAVV